MKEKTNRKSVAPRKVKGTVLFTVVCVMMVLIVFLLGTLALAATANKRANYNFQKEQTETIARSVLDSVVTALNDTTINDPSNTNSIRHQVENMPNTGMDMQVHIKQVNADGTDGAGYDDYTVNVVPANQTMWLYDDVSDSWYQGDVYQMSTTVTTAAGNAPSTYSIYLFRGTTPGNPGSGGGGGGGAFVSLGEVGGKIGTSGNVTGGTQFGIGSATLQNFELDNNTVTQSPFFVNGNLRAGSGVTSYFTALGNANQKQYVAVTGSFTPGNNFKIGAMVDLANDWNYEVTDLNSGVVTQYTNRGKNDIPTFFVGDTFYYATNAISYGDANTPINIYAGDMQPEYNGGTVPAVEITGNLYLFDDSKKSVLNLGLNGSTSLLYDWGSSFLDDLSDVRTYDKEANSTKNFGNFYTAGSVELNFSSGIKNPLCAGDFRVAKDLTIGNCNNVSEIEVGGDFVVGGTFTCSSNITIKCKNFYGAKPANVTVVASGTVADSCPYTIYPSGNSKSDVENNIVNPPTMDEYTGAGSADTYPTTEAELSTDNFKKFIGVNPPMETVNNSNLSSKSTNGVYCVSSDTRFENVTLDKTLYIDATAGKKVIIFDNCNIQDGNSIIINNRNASGKQNEVYFFMKSTGENYADIVKNNTNPWWTPDPTRSSLCVSGGSIMTIDWAEHVTGQTIDLSNASTINLKLGGGFTMPATDPSDSTKTGYNEVDKYGDNWSFPHVYIYGEEDSLLLMGNNGMVTANVRAPKMTFKQTNAAKSSGDLIYKEKDSTTGTTYGPDQNFSGKEVGLVGQLICGMARVSNEWGMLYVSKDPPGTGGGGSGWHGSYTGNQVYTTLYFNYF